MLEDDCNYAENDQRDDGAINLVMYFGAFGVSNRIR